MKAIICAMLSGVALFLSMNQGQVWLLAWFAPMPLLWLAFRQEPRWRLGLAGFAAFALGQFNLQEAHANLGMMIWSLVLPSAAFAVALLFVRSAAHRLAPLLAVFAFPVFWTSFEYLHSLISPNGTFGSLAYSQIDAPFLIQSAALFGMWSVTFLLCFFASAFAIVLSLGKDAFPVSIIALVLLGGNVAYGVISLGQPQKGTERVGLAANDALGHLSFADTFHYALSMTTAYADAARELAHEGATTIVMPENVAILNPSYREQVIAPLTSAAKETGATIVTGFTEQADKPRNIALTFSPSGTVSRYVKRHKPSEGIKLQNEGQTSEFLDSGRSMALSHDMDLPDTSSAEAQSHPSLVYIAATDFGLDSWRHARMASMRGVENGFAVVRSATDGLLTVTDAQGRLVAQSKSSKTDMVTLVANVSPGPGVTPYLHMGDVFPWVCLGLLAGMILVLFLENEGRQKSG